MGISNIGFYNVSAKYIPIPNFLTQNIVFSTFFNVEERKHL